jgi:hypothetical protein
MGNHEEISMTHTIEYRDMNSANASHLTIIATGESATREGRVIRLEHATSGYELAGSCARWTDGYWAVRFNENDGTLHGRRFRDEGEARTLFAAWTK